jgi:hypothetical protein
MALLRCRKGRIAGTAAGFVHLKERTGQRMTDIHEQKIVDQIDREVLAPDGLIALVVCLSVTVGLAMAGVMTFLGSV